LDKREREREKVTGGWKELHNTELQSDQFIARLVGHVACMGGMGHAGTILVGEHDRRRALGIPVQNWGDDDIMREIEGMSIWSR
jgi:hypothetical protein